MREKGLLIKARGEFRVVSDECLLNGLKEGEGYDEVSRK